ncbi:hypothetical protein IRJ41_013154 [Triplophysa rosa]|uniref:Uncharacterized protein n=1 Tax=Triplophysa rosa TaxID=992332 RepID=A0A9W7WK44_TRIRA|nr:hypothetical protein IRJ41_013154 [Triplophysa rosa]
MRPTGRPQTSSQRAQWRGAGSRRLADTHTPTQQGLFHRRRENLTSQLWGWEAIHLTSTHLALPLNSPGGFQPPFIPLPPPLSYISHPKLSFYRFLT